MQINNKGHGGVIRHGEIMRLTKRTLNWINKINETTSLKLETKRLLSWNVVEVGYRATCGCTDKTRKDYDVFMKLIKSLESQGVVIRKDIQKHDNRWATNNGGFWCSYKFQIESDIK